MLSLFAFGAMALFGQIAAAGQSFAGTNLYYAAGLKADMRAKYLDSLQDASIRVLRVWLDGQHSGGTKGTDITEYAGLEPSSVGTYDDTVLSLLDDFMVESNKRGIKLLISMHSWNSLSGGSDPYAQNWGKDGFYTNSDATSAFDARLAHILAHEHSSLGKPWSALGDYIFAFEAQNEAMIGLGEQFIKDNTAWQCDRAAALKKTGTTIPISTGGASWLDESLQAQWFDCEHLDILAIHAYGPGDYSTDKLQGYTDKATAAGKKLIMQEWGACYFDTENNNCPQGGVLDVGTRNDNIQKWAAAISAAGIPWMYWQILPNNDPHYGYDFEVASIGEEEDPSWQTLKQAAKDAESAESPWDWEALLDTGANAGAASASASGSKKAASKTVDAPSGVITAPPKTSDGSGTKHKYTTVVTYTWEA
ncbi:glycoside hydrolase family 5 protein [Geopyxis carbonaria]|nr:glycoside hydrolase family 5 protein [Geopyxis carbonaria]